MIKLRKDYQLPVKTAILTAWQKVRAVLAVMATGGGKCLAKGTPVLMFDGTVKNVEDIKPGDLLMGPDSKPRTVLTTCRGREEMFRVTPTKGDSYEVNASHILSLKKTGTNKIVNIEVRDYVKQNNNFKHLHKGWRAGVDWSTGTYDGALPPYLLGLWLGDGTSRGAAITTEDHEVAEYLRTFCAGRVYPLREETISPENNAKTYHIRGNGRHSHTTLSELRRFDLLQNKHIPRNYKTAPRADRLALLAGLVDSDGSLHHNGYDFVFKSKRLAEDVIFVARSLGFAAYLKKCKKTCTNTGAAGEYWRFNISGDLSEVPTLLSRKHASPRRQKKDVLKTGIAVESIGEGDYYGFEIDGDHLFMLGDFTVTHNTVVFASIIHDHKGASAAVVHRKEIVVQISCSLALLGVKHRIVAPPATVRLARRKHLEKFGKSFVDPAALCGVASVQTLTSKSAAKNTQLQSWLRQVTLCVFDEGHHYIKTGLWARAVDAMVNAKLLQVSACSERADGKGLGVDADGFAEELVEGPQVKWLIREGYLSPFKYFAPTTDLDLEGVAVTASGDFNSKALRARVVESHIVGDVVKQYLQFAKGKRAIVFATDVATANEMADSFNANGVRAIALDGTTEDSVRDKASADFEHGSLDVLVNVDLFDEGYDVPAAECAILARPTQSLNKFLQMCGRVLRVVYGKGYDLETQEGRLAAIANGGKPNAIIIDPVRNWERHGMPDWPRQWTLAGKEKGTRTNSDTIPQRVCDACTQPYEALHKACPYCGAEPEPAGRSLPEQVDGDLLELDVDAMAALFEKMRKADCSDEEFQRGLFARNVPAVGHSKQLKAHRDAKYRREVLRQLVGWWVGAQEGRDLSEVHRRFFHRFGVDIATAFTLDAKQTDALADKIAACFSLDAVLT